MQKTSNVKKIIKLRLVQYASNCTKEKLLKLFREFMKILT